MIETGTLLQNRYLIAKQIGAGGMGAVYLAVDQRFDNHVAIKETFYQDDELGEAFEREARLLNSLHHPGLPHVSDYFSEAGGNFLVMQYIEGEDLSEILKRSGAFPVTDVVRWTEELLDALDFLHSQEPPIIHRDIKPQNLKITPRGDIVLLDFGLAKLKHEDTSNVKSIFGYSRKYSPLEQIQGTGTDARSDIFALAATVYHLFTGKAPHDALSRASAIVAGNPDPLVPAHEIREEIPAAVSNVLQTALALNPAQRFANASAMRLALKHAVGTDSSEPAEEAPLLVGAPAIIEPVASRVETENFPALEAFADEVKSAPQPKEETPTPIVVSPPKSEHSAPVKIPAPTNHVEAVTRVATRKNKSRLPLAAAIVLILAVCSGAFYFIKRANTSAAPVETPVAQATPETAPEVAPSETPAEQPLEAAVTPSPEAPEVFSASSLEDDEPAEAPPSRTAAEKRETTERRESPEAPRASTEKPKPAPQTPRSDSQPARPKRNVGDGETRSRVVGAETVPDIESIFTGRPSPKKGDVRRNEITDEERRELRRQRRQERRRQNRNNFPF